MSSIMFSVVLFVCLWATLKLETDCDEILLGGGEGPGWQKEVKENRENKDYTRGNCLDNKKLDTWIGDARKR